MNYFTDLLTAGVTELLDLEVKLLEDGFHLGSVVVYCRDADGFRVRSAKVQVAPDAVMITCYNYRFSRVGVEIASWLLWLLSCNDWYDWQWSTYQ